MRETQKKDDVSRSLPELGGTWNETRKKSTLD